MYASEYIRKLQALLDEHGDLYCEDNYGNQVDDPEEATGVFVLYEGEE
jgi:hypothetical protein